MDIPALSTAMAGQNVSTNVAISLTKKTMDVAEQQMQGYVQMMQAASNKLDMRI